MHPNRDRLTLLALYFGMAVPVLYFGMQLVAAQFYPGYSFLTQSASQLGSDLSPRPEILNGGAMATGLAIIISSIGFGRALPRAGSPRIVTWLTCLALLSAGAGGIWAGYFPLPDPRHNPKAIGIGVFLLPALFTIALWNASRGRGIRTYLLANVIAFALLIPVMAGAVVDTRTFHGLLQRVAAAVVYVPIGVTAAFLRRRVD